VRPNGAIVLAVHVTSAATTVSRALAAALMVLAAIGVAWAVSGPPLGSPARIVTGACVSYFVLRWPVFSVSRRTLLIFDLQEGVVVALALLLPPAGLILAVTAGVLPWHLRRRTTWFKRLANIAVLVTAGSAAAAVAASFDTVDRPAAWLGAVVAGSVYLVVSMVLVSIFIRLRDAVPLRATLAPAPPRQIATALAAMATGCACASVALSEDMRPLLALGPVVLLGQISRQAHTAGRDRERLAAMLDVTGRSEDAATHDELERVLVDGCRALFGTSDVVEVTDSADAHGGLIAAHTGERTVVVRRGWGEPWTSEDHQIAGAIRAMAMQAVRRLDERDQLQRSALVDPLTGIANRRQLDRVLAATIDTRAALTLVLLDLDGFKAVNDEMGHAAGDHLLAEVATRLEATIRPFDTVARLGGDEFVVVLPGQTSTSSAVERVESAFRLPFVIGSRELLVRPSIGAATHPDDGSTATDLLESADRRMYEAKRRQSQSRRSR
jgi:diguanylate cyclase (GGDEF)-like protein